MSIEAKQLLLTEIEGTLASKLTAETLRTVMAEIETGMMETPSTGTRHVGNRTHLTSCYRLSLKRKRSKGDLRRP